MNDLEKKIYEKITKSVFVTPESIDSTTRLIWEHAARISSEFFLEGIKEAYIQSYDDNIDELTDENKEWISINFEGYLKSKYNIDPQ